MLALGSKNLVPQEKYGPFFARPFFLMEFLLTELLLWDFFGRFFGQQKIHRPRIPGAPKNGKLPILFPYHSHIFRDSYGISNEKIFG